jgi:hypothetical protein
MEYFEEALVGVCVCVCVECEGQENSKSDKWIAEKECDGMITFDIIPVLSPSPI